MKQWSVCLLFLASLQGFSTDLPNEEFIDNYSEDNQSYGETYARLTYVGKSINVFHEGTIEEAAVRNLPIVSGDYIESGYSSFGELEFIDGSLMQFADKTKLEFQAINEVYSNESLTVVRLEEGQLFLHIADNPDFYQDQVFRIDSRGGSAYIEAPGIYMVSFQLGRMKLKTYRGLAELSGEYGSVLVHSGEFSSIRGMGTPVNVVAFNSFRGNDFQRWAYDRRPLLDSASTRYVDGAIASYSRDLDDHGEWRYSQNLSSHVWVPYHRNDWRPYYNGYWSPIAGRLTWVSYDPFGYVTHHYGRWGWSLDFGWYWIPGAYYSPGWVAWTTYDSYVGWCPLGNYNRPYYYGRNHYNTVIIKNNTYHWNYISIRDVSTRRAVRITHRRFKPSHNRRITTRAIYLSDNDLRDGRRIARIIREPKVNRTRYAERRSNQGTIVSHTRLGRAERTQISGRASGTRATSRYAATTRQVRQQRIKPEGSGLVQRSPSRAVPKGEKAPSATRRNRQATNSPQRYNAPSRSAQPSRTDRSPKRAEPSRQSNTRTAPSPRRYDNSNNSRATQRTAPPKRQSTSRTAPPKQRQSTRSSPPKQRQTAPPSQRQRTTRTAPPSRNRQSTRSTPPPRSQQRTSRSASPKPRSSAKPRSTAPKQRRSGNATRKPTKQQRQAPAPRSSARKPKPKEKNNN